MFKTQALIHQASEHERTKDLKAWASFWEMGCGKTWVAINTAAHLAREGKIEGVLVLAPNGVHRNWVSDEIPKHWPDDVDLRTFCWRGDRSSTKWHQQEAKALLDHPGLVLVCASYDSFMTDKGRLFCTKLLESRPCLYVLDESARIKSPSAKRTRAVVLSGKKAPYRRILSGTPVANSPFDVYPQVKFLDEEFWKARGFASYEAFKTYFGVWEQRVNGATGQRFNTVVGYKNLEELRGHVAAISSRVTKDEVLDLPDKVYAKRYFRLTPEQHKLYEDLRKEFATFLDSGEMVSAPLVIVRLTRLQQVISGFLPSDDGEVVHEIPGGNPRLQALEDVLEDVPGQAIIWAKYTREIDQVMALLGDQAVRYDGQVKNPDREAAKLAFQEGRARYFVANPAAGAEGLTLIQARTVVYYSNSFNLTHRLQSEDRAHRIGQQHNVLYVDLMAEGTVDEHVVKKLRDKNLMAGSITGDEVRTWL